jgi:D-glycero-D-manno-heptose 1,7-bisphosphate phosphatase
MLIILDRDGVINQESANYIRSPEDWQPIPGSLAAIAQLNHAGHTVVIATNQSGLGRGYFNEATLNAIHEKMYHALANLGGHIDGIYYCPHIDADKCECRKPKPGLLWQIKRDYPTLYQHAIFVGDNLRDLQAAAAGGIRGVWIADATHPKPLPAPFNTWPRHPDLQAFVHDFLAGFS